MQMGWIIDGSVYGAQAVATIVAADFTSGFFHWLEDCYGNEKTPLLGKWIIVPNVTHHHHPHRFVGSNFLKRNWITLTVSLCMFLIVLASGGFTWHWLLALSLIGIVNEIHCWAHRSAKVNGKLITFLQKTGILQSRRKHALHHRGNNDKCYCAITDWLNPLLDRVKFFPTLEFIVNRLFGLSRRLNTPIPKPNRFA